MSNIEQKVSDTLSVVQSISETSKAANKNTETLDEHVGQVGRVVVDLHNTTEKTHTSVLNQEEVIKQVREGQFEIKKYNDNLAQIIADTVNKFDGHEEVLTSIKNILNAVNQTQDDHQKELLSKLDISNNQYAENVGELIRTLQSTNTEIEKIDANETLVALLKKVTETTGSLSDVKHSTDKYNEEVNDKLQELNQSLGNSITKLSELSENSQKISEDFQTAISRLNTISLKLDSTNELEETDKKGTDTDVVDDKSTNEKEIEGE